MLSTDRSAIDGGRLRWTRTFSDAKGRRRLPVQEKSLVARLAEPFRGGGGCQESVSGLEFGVLLPVEVAAVRPGGQGERGS